MPQQKVYEFTDPDSGMTIEVEGPSPPSEAVVRMMFATARKQPPPPDSPSVMESTASRIGRTVTNALPTVGGMAGGFVGSAGGPAVAAGLSALGGAAGRLAQRAVQGAQGYDVPQGADLALDAAEQGAMQGAAEVVGTGAAKALSGAGRAVYRGYLKPPLSERMLPKAEQTVTTAIREGLPVTESGKDAGQKIIGELKAEVDALLQGSNRMIDLKTVANRIRAHARSKYYRPGRDLSDFNAAMAVADKIDTHPSLGIPPGVNPTAIRVRLADANAIKRALDQSIGDTQFGVVSGAKTATEKFGRHELNQALQSQMPAIRGLNQRESQLIDAVKAIERAVAREANTNQLTGWRSLVSGTATAGNIALGQDPQTATAMGLLLRGGLDPRVASRLAIVATRASGQLGLGLTEAIRLTMLALQNAEEPQRRAEQPQQSPRIDRDEDDKQ
jgi:hypothetical protein